MEKTLSYKLKKRRKYLYLIPQDLQISQKHQSIEKPNGSGKKSHTLCLSFKFATQICLETGVSLSSSQVMLTQDKNR